MIRDGHTVLFPRKDVKQHENLIEIQNLFQTLATLDVKILIFVQLISNLLLQMHSKMELEILNHY